MSSVDGARPLHFGSYEEPESICSPCHYNGTEKESHFCEDCREHLCRNCAAAHIGLRMSRNHKVSALRNLMAQTALTQGTACNIFCDCNMNLSHADIKLPSDNSIPSISGCTFLPDGQAILCDTNNNNVKMLNSSFTVKEVLKLQSDPWDVSVLSNSNAVITLPFKKQIQFLQTVPTLTTVRTIQLEKQCWGVEVAAEEIYVTCHGGVWNGEVRVLDMAGYCKRRLGINQDGTFMFVALHYVTLSADAATLYVSEAASNTITRLKIDGSVINKYQNKNLNKNLKQPRGMCVDGAGNMVVCSQDSNEVHIVTSDGRKNKTLLSSKDGVKNPLSVAYNDGTLIVGCWNSTNLFVYKER